MNERGHMCRLFHTLVIRLPLACRYAVLQEFGGYYIDLDIECLRPLDFLGRYPYVMPKTRPVGFSNDFMASEPGNNFVGSMVAALPKWNLNLLLKYPTVMFSTGPMFVTLKVRQLPSRLFAQQANPCFQVCA